VRALLRALFLGGLVVAAGFVWSTASGMPDPMASRFSASGACAGRMPRAVYRGFMTGVTVCVPLVLYLALGRLPRWRPRFADIPHREFWFSPQRHGRTLDFLERHALATGAGLALLLVGMHALFLQANRNVPPSTSMGVWMALAGLFLAWVLAAAFTLSARFRRRRD